MSTREPWNDEAVHVQGPDALHCPFCRGELVRGVGPYAVVLANYDRPEVRIFSSPHTAWSYWDRVRMSWVGSLLVEVVAGASEVASRPRVDAESPE